MESRGSSGWWRGLTHGHWRSATVVSMIIVLCGLAAGAAFGMRESAVEQAKATILINPLDGNPFSTTGNGDDLVNMYTESELLKSDAVSELVAADLGLDESAASVRQGLSVAVPPNSQIIEVEYESRSKADSVARAQSFAEQYLLFRRARAEERTADQTAQVRQQVRERTNEQDKLAEDLADAPPNSTSASVLQARLDAVSAQVNQLRARMTEINSAPINPGQVVTPSAGIDRGLLAHWFVYVIAGGLAGLMLAFALAVIRGRLDNRIHGSEDIFAVGHTVLGEVPRNQVLRFADFPTGDLPPGAIGEDLRRLRVALLTTDRRRPLVVLLATASPSQSRPITAESLALVLAASRLQTILVDTVADLDAAHPTNGDRKASIEEIIADDGVPQRGLTTVRPFIKVMRSEDPLAMEDTVQTPQMTWLLEALQEVGDIVIVSAGSVYESRTQALAASCDALIIEAVAGESTYPDLMGLKDLVRPVRDKVLGMVLVTDTKSKSVSKPASDSRAMTRSASRKHNRTSKDRTAKAKSSEGPAATSPLVRSRHAGPATADSTPPSGLRSSKGVSDAHD